MTSSNQVRHSAKIFELSYWWKEDPTLILAFLSRHAVDRFVQNLPYRPEHGTTCIIMPHPKAYIYVGEVDGWIEVPLADGWEFIRVNRTDRYRVIEGEIVQIRDMSTSDLAYDIIMQIPYEPLPGEILLNVRVPQELYLRRNAPGSTGYLPRRVAASPSPVFRLTKNGAQVGRIVFPTNGYVAAFDVPATTHFGLNDVLGVSGPDREIIGLSDMGLVLRLQPLAVTP